MLLTASCRVIGRGSERNLWNAGDDTYGAAATTNYDHVGELYNLVKFECANDQSIDRIIMSGLSNGAAMVQRYA